MPEEPNKKHDKKNVSKPNTRIYAYTKGDAEVGGSKVIIGQLPNVNKLARVLFGSGAIHSFMSIVFADYLGRNKEVLDKASRRSYRLVMLCCQATGHMMCQ